MAEELAEDEEVEAPEQVDSVEELPLQAMYHRESQVLITPFQVVSNLLRLLRSEGKVISSAFYRCHFKRVRQAAEEFEDCNIRWVLRT